MPARKTGDEERRERASAANARKLEKLRRAVQIGVEAIERGEHSDVDDADLDACLDSLVEEARPATSKLADKMGEGGKVRRSTRPLAGGA